MQTHILGKEPNIEKWHFQGFIIKLSFILFHLCTEGVKRLIDKFMIQLYTCWHNSYTKKWIFKKVVMLVGERQNGLLKNYLRFDKKMLGAG